MGFHCQKSCPLPKNCNSWLCPFVVYMKGPMVHLCKWENFSLKCDVVESNTNKSLSFFSSISSKYLSYGYCVFCSCKKYHCSNLISWEILFFECLNTFFLPVLVCLLEWNFLNISHQWNDIYIYIYISQLKFV